MKRDNTIRALRILKEFCYSHETCHSCQFYELTEDMGFLCHIQKIVDDVRFIQRLNTYTISADSGTVSVGEEK